jgi:hypothetical protein
MEEGQPRQTAVSQSDVADGWRDHCAEAACPSRSRSGEVAPRPTMPTRRARTGPAGYWTRAAVELGYGPGAGRLSRWPFAPAMRGG